jgi:hypothetical protein
MVCLAPARIFSAALEKFILHTVWPQKVKNCIMNKKTIKNVLS